MPQDLSAERASFEAWLNPGRHDGNVSPWVEPGRYADCAHNMAWLGWRYGREAQAAEIARLQAERDDLRTALQEADTIMGHDDSATEWRDEWAPLF